MTDFSANAPQWWTEQTQWTAPARHETLDHLIVTWAKRDDLYSRQKTAMTDHEADVIRQSRMAEADMLPNRQERKQAYIRAKTWYPPSHGQGRR